MIYGVWYIYKNGSRNGWCNNTTDHIRGDLFGYTGPIFKTTNINRAFTFAESVRTIDPERHLLDVEVKETEV